MVDAAQLMDRRIPRVRLDDPAHQCIRRLGPSGHLIVVDQHGRLVGTLDEPLLRRAHGLARAVELASEAPTARPSDRSHVPFHALCHSPSTCVVVVDDDDRPLGLITRQDAVQLARFVLPPRWRVRELMQQSLSPARPPHRARVHADDEARHAADVLAMWGGPVLVLSREGQPLGMVSERHVVCALADALAPGNAVFVHAVP